MVALQWYYETLAGGATTEVVVCAGAELRLQVVWAAYYSPCVSVQRLYFESE